MNPTHRATVQHREVVEEIDDGMGGTTERRDWVDVHAGIFVRYLPEGVGLSREEQGDRFRDSPSVLIHARDVGSIDADGEYDLGLDAGDDWRLHIEGLTDIDDDRLSITNYRPIYGDQRVPASVQLELEALT